MDNRSNVITIFVSFFVIFIVSITSGILIGKKLGGGGGTMEHARVEREKAPGKRPREQQGQPQKMNDGFRAADDAREPAKSPPEKMKVKEPLVQRGPKSPVVKTAVPTGAPRVVKKTTPKPAPRKVASLPKVSEKGKYTVQIGSFTIEELAKKREMALKKLGYPAFIKKALVPNKGIWYRVRVGTFNSRAEAKSYGELLSSKEESVDTVFITFNN